jgi:hypothetical protein
MGGTLAFRVFIGVLLLLGVVLFASSLSKTSDGESIEARQLQGDHMHGHQDGLGNGQGSNFPC